MYCMSLYKMTGSKVTVRSFRRSVPSVTGEGVAGSGVWRWVCLVHSPNRTRVDLVHTSVTENSNSEEEFRE